jgi:hypothetical protein
MSKITFIVRLLVFVFLISFGRGKGEESQSRNSDDNVGVFVESDEANTIYRKIARHLGFLGDPNSQDCLTFVEDKLTIEFHPSHSPVYIVGKELLDLFPNYKPVIVVCNRDATTWIARLNTIALAARSSSKTEFAYEFIAEFGLFLQEHFGKFYFIPDEVCKEEIDPEGLIVRLHSIRESAISFEPTANNINPIVDDLLALVHRHFSDLRDDFDDKFLKDSYVRSAREALAIKMGWDELDEPQQNLLMEKILKREFSHVWVSHNLIQREWRDSANVAATSANFHLRIQEENGSMVAALAEATRIKRIEAQAAIDSRAAQMKLINAAYADYMLTIAELRATQSRQKAIDMMREKRENIRQYEYNLDNEEMKMQERMNEYRKSLGLPELP